MRRLREGCRRLNIPLPDEGRLHAEAHRLIAGCERCVLKVIITRGPGGRGYRAPPAATPTRVLQVSPWPGFPSACRDCGVAIRLCSQRLGINPALAGIKHLNRLEQVLARQEWDDPDIHEGLLCDTSGNVIEGTMSNLFVVHGEKLLTPDLARCGVAGIMRSVILELAGRLGIESVVRVLPLAELEAADELFLTNGIIGIWPVIRLEQAGYRKGPITRELQTQLAELNTEGEAWHP
jgi:4-amino-4-deoxychorismate lyase